LFLAACAAVTVVVLLLLIARVPLHPALALIVAALGIGVASGMTLNCTGRLRDMRILQLAIPR
jgi:H+/gluconate symporter-like permease